MKKTIIALLFTFVAFAMLAPAPVHAAPAAQQAKPTPKPKPKHTVIESVDANSITVKVGDAKTITYKITPQTEITFKGNSVKVTDLKPGQRVSVTAGMDATVAARIAADDAPKDPPAKDK